MDIPVHVGDEAEYYSRRIKKLHKIIKNSMNMKKYTAISYIKYGKTLK